MHDHDKGRARFLGQHLEQMLQCTDAAGRGADADHDGFGAARLSFLVPLLLACFTHRAAHFFFCRLLYRYQAAFGPFIRSFGKEILDRLFRNE